MPTAPDHGRSSAAAIRLTRKREVRGMAHGRRMVTNDFQARRFPFACPHPPAGVITVEESLNNLPGPRMNTNEHQFSQGNGPGRSCWFVSIPGKSAIPWPERCGRPPVPWRRRRKSHAGGMLCSRFPTAPFRLALGYSQLIHKKLLTNRPAPAKSGASGVGPGAHLRQAPATQDPSYCVALRTKMGGNTGKQALERRWQEA